MRERGMVDEGVVGVRSLLLNSRRLAEGFGVHCLLSLGGLRGRSLGVTLVTRSVRWVSCTSVGLPARGRTPES